MPLNGAAFGGAAAGTWASECGPYGDGESLRGVAILVCRRKTKKPINLSEPEQKTDHVVGGNGEQANP